MLGRASLIPPLLPAAETRMPLSVKGGSSLRTKLAFVSKPAASDWLVERTPASSLTATLTTICIAVEKRVSIMLIFSLG